ncbi:zinc finger protein 142 isoform X3 [Perognathus longimembris pacificus]|uniref:zinc finger protein 142 isoform X3 n=1 Tax=Perognathus longimembris pacificus TaxID=214514 RepID=UPI0020199E38|nr:zinc finger protein 142 isoform X3 [Perognathus longimembris pacificus]
MTDPVLDSQPARSTGEMDGLCSELLLIPPSLSNHGILGPVPSACASGDPAPLPADSGCLLVEATATEEGPGNMEIIVETVAGALSPGTPGETPGTSTVASKTVGQATLKVLSVLFLVLLSENGNTRIVLDSRNLNTHA